MTHTFGSTHSTPLWVTTRETNGTLMGAPSFEVDLSLKIGGGPSVSVVWDEGPGLGVCSYPLTTEICGMPMSLSIEADGFVSPEGLPLSPASTHPSSILGILPNTIVPLSNFVTSQTCFHFISLHPITKLLALGSYAPMDPSLLTWSMLPSVVADALSFQITLAENKLLVNARLESDILSFVCPIPDVTNSSLASVSFTQFAGGTPGYSRDILASSLLNGRPLLVCKELYGASVWLPSQGSLLGVNEVINGLESDVDISKAVVIGNPTTIWLLGITSGLPELIKYDLLDTPHYYGCANYSDLEWSDISVTPSGVFLTSQSGLWKFNGSGSDGGSTWEGFGGPPALGVLPVVWSDGDPLDPSTNTSIIGVHVLTNTQYPLEASSETLSLITTEFFRFASLEETPSWASSINIQPVALDTPRWDDRIVYNAPEVVKPTPGNTNLRLLATPPFTTSGPLNRLDPTGSYIVSQNVPPTPNPVSVQGLLVATSSQIYQAPHPDVKLGYSLLKISAPEPALAKLEATYFPLQLPQSELGVIIDPALVTTFKAILTTSNTLKVSLIALNTAFIHLGSDKTELPPVLIDYEIPYPSGLEELSATLHNTDHVTTVFTSVYNSLGAF